MIEPAEAAFLWVSKAVDDLQGVEISVMQYEAEP